MSVSRGIRARVATMTAEERFWPHVEKTASCWTWKGAGRTLARGYGRFQPVLGSRKLVQAHRFAYELMRGPIPDGLQLDHLCRNHFCVNPAHLEAVTARVNSHRSLSVSGLNAAKTACPLGHPYSIFGHLDPKSGKRYCRECGRLKMAVKRGSTSRRMSKYGPARELAGTGVEIETVIRVRKQVA